MENLNLVLNTACPTSVFLPIPLWELASFFFLVAHSLFWSSIHVLSSCKIIYEIIKKRSPGSTWKEELAGRQKWVHREKSCHIQDTLLFNRVIKL